MENKKTIGVFFGGESPEHDVSIITGQLIISGLEKLGYNVAPVYIGKNGNWFIDKKLGSIKFFQESEKGTALKKTGGFYLDLEKPRGKMVFKKKGLLSQETIIDIAFPAFHGLKGEDGTIQGLFEIIGVPYIGSNTASSAIAIDKVLTKLFYQSQNIPTTKFIYFSKQEWDEDKTEVLNKIQSELEGELFVKPARLGSSIGIKKVSNKKDLEFAIEVALHYDDKVLVEEAVENLADLTCALLGNNNPRQSLVQETVFNDQLLSYDEKYLKEGGTQTGKAEQNIIIPANVNEETTKKIQDMAVKIFKMLECSGTARVDFLYNKKTQKLYANEVNTLPGTLYHHLWKKSGIELGELLETLINLAQEKHSRKKELTTVFESDILKQPSSAKL